nr:hypothetical protein [Methylomicrobium lacus]
MTITTQLDQLCINTLRTLSIDAVQQAQSGHPGTPMDAAPTAYCFYGSVFCATTRRTPTGRTATASCYRPITRRCCCIACFICARSRR